MNSLPSDTILQNCRLCPRNCGVNRVVGKRGFCGAGAAARVYRYGPHFGEEPPITGTQGSGTVFFSHCTLRCIYCQNFPWSQKNQGEDRSTAQLSAILQDLYDRGCHNWNLVSPTPWLPQIRAAVAPLIARDIRLPFVYNTSGFESIGKLDTYRDLVDIALTDLRYAHSETAAEASHAAEYVTISRRVLKWFWNELGSLQTDSAGIAKRGTICRLLVLPGHVDEAIDNLAWIAQNIGTAIHVSVMSQYTPAHLAVSRSGWNRRVTEAEYRRVTDAAEAMGFDNGWIQPYQAVESNEWLGCEMPADEGAVGQ